jgi:transcription elongation GreA/GreB family factor
VRDRATDFESPAQDGEVELGERVTVLDLTTSVASDFRVVDLGRPREAVEISHRSLLGAALLGRHVGDILEVATPGGTVRLEVVEIDG